MEETSPSLPFTLIGGLFLAVGLGMAINILLGLLTGGPRDRSQPNRPRLYDRAYYLLMLFVLAGWSVALLSFDHETLTQTPDGFLVGWGIMAIGLGLLYLLRLDMMTTASKYLSQQGFVLFRPYHSMRHRQLERQRGSVIVKIVPVLFMVLGMGVLAFYLPHLAEMPTLVEAGVSILIEQIRGVVTGNA